MEAPEEIDLLIVGAGLHGLILAKTYIQVNPASKVLIVDYARSIGGSWAKERLYPGLKTNNIIGSYEFGDFPMIPQRYGLKLGDHIPGHVVHEYLSDFATHYHLHERIALETRAVSSTLQDDNCWLVNLESELPGRTAYLKARKIVLATGLTSQPRMPIFPGQETFRGEIFHAKELQNRSNFLETAKSIVVIGGNKSAWDTCYHAARLGARVHMVIRPSGAGPSYIWPSSFKWGPFQLSQANLVATRIFAPFDPSPFGKMTIFGWVRNFFHETTIGQKLCQLFWNRLDHLIKTLHGFREHPELKKLEPWSTPFWFGNASSIHNYETSWFDLVREGAIAIHIAEVDSLSIDSVLLGNGEKVEADAVVCCTGWKREPPVNIYPPEAGGAIIEDIESPETSSDISEASRFISRKVPFLSSLPRRTPNACVVDEFQKAQESPLQLYRYTVPWQQQFLQTKNIAFMGMEHSIGAVVVAQVQALWVTAFLDDKIAHLRPSALDTNAVRYDTLLHSLYQKQRRPREAGGAAGKYPDLVFDTLAYVDTLMKDLELSPYRKQSWWKECFEPYRPKDYKGIVHEWINIVEYQDVGYKKST